MSTYTFIAQDAAGNRCRINVLREHDIQNGSSATPGHSEAAYRLEDGTPVHRVDNETFKVAGTGAYITLVREYE